MKKLLVMLLTLTLLSGLLTGCGKSGESGETDMPQMEEGEKSEEQGTVDKEAIKIGVSIWGVTDNQGALCKKYLDYAAEALGIELVYALHGAEADAVVNSMDNLIQSGCQGIIVCNYSDGEMVSSIDICEKAGVYLTQFFRTISDEEMKEYVESSEYFAGRVHEDEYNNGYNLASIMAEKGCKNVVLISYSHGDSTAETRYKGYTDAFAEKGVNLLAEQWEIRTSEDAAAAMETFMAAYPECDGVAIVGVTESLGGVMSAVESAGRTGEFVVVSTDFITTLEEDMEKNAVSAMAGGHEMDPVYSLLICYNAICGAFDPSEMPVDLEYPYVNVADTTDVANYFKYFEGDIPALDAEEIRALTATYNENFKLSDMEEAISKMSVADAQERHSHYFE